MRPFLLFLFVQRTYHFLKLPYVKINRFEYCDFRLFRLMFILTMSALGADIATLKLTNLRTYELTNRRTLEYLMKNTPLNSLSLPAPKEMEAAIRGQRQLATYLSTKLETQEISILDAHDIAHRIELPTSALTLLMSILGELATGNAVQIVPVQAELTTQEAANILNVSRPHMVKLLEEGHLPFHKTGRHRRVLFADLMQYKEQRENESMQAMQELTDRSQELGFY